MNISNVLNQFSKNYKNNVVTEKARFQCDGDQLVDVCNSLVALNRSITLKDTQALSLFNTTMCSGDIAPNIPFHQQYGYDENMIQNFDEIGLSFKYVARSGNITILLTKETVDLINSIIS